MNSPIVKDYLGLEDLILTPEVSADEVVAAADEMNKGQDAEVLLIEQDQVVGKISENGQAILEVAARLETFTRTAEAQLAGNTVTPEVVQAYATVTETELRRVEEDPVTLSVESFGSVRVALESHVTNIRDKIKALLEWFRKIVAAAFAAIKKYFNMLFDTVQRAELKAKYYRKAALALKSGALRDRSEPREPTVAVNGKFLGFHKAHGVKDIERGLAVTVLNIGPTLDAITKSAKYTSEATVDAARDFATGDYTKFDIDAVLKGQPQLKPTEQSGGATIVEERIGNRCYYEVQLPNAGKEAATSTPNADQIAAVADRVLELLGGIKKLDKVYHELTGYSDKQSSALEVAAKSATTGSDDADHRNVVEAQFSALTKLCQRDYSHDLEKIANYYIRVALAANEFCRASLTKYPGHLPLVS